MADGTVAFIDYIFVSGLNPDKGFATDTEIEEDGTTTMAAVAPAA